MAESRNLKDPWLIAAWPGIGNVAVGAAAYLVEQLGASFVRELPSEEFFDTSHVEVEDGIASAPTPPRSMIFEWSNGTSEHDLVIFLGEAQPSDNGMTLCRRLVDYATSRGVTRAFTFAAMATQLHPSATPRVFGAATEKELLPELREHGVELLGNGQIGGLNGVLLAACAERRIPGACFLGELPFFAAGVQNPKASAAVLEVFTRLAKIDIDFEKIREAGQEVETAILDLLEQMKDAAKQQREQTEEEGPEFPTAYEPVDEPVADEPAEKEPELSAAERAKLERLFEKAEEDKEAAFQLKEHLDRLGVFERYEDRFLDLFKRGE